MEAVHLPPLRDGRGRIIDTLRISVTDRCNFGCPYCMPAEGLAWIPRSEVLSYEEITRIAVVASGLGIRKLRLTGGEPLVRAEVPRLVAMLTGVEGIQDLSLTTNGYLLAELAPALAAA